MSGKKTKIKRKAEVKKIVASIMAQAAVGEAPKLELQTATQALKLDLAGGQNVREGFEGVDIWPESKHVVNLLQFPWPWADNSVDEIYCSHFIEHIPMIYVNALGHEVPCGSTGAQDLLFRFFDECWRVLKPDGWGTFIVPNARSNRGFQDPTHRRFFVAETFLYLFSDWRKANKLDHYNVRCNFGGGDPTKPDIVPIIQMEYNALSEEVQARKFNHEWNTILDWQAKLRAIK